MSKRVTIKPRPGLRVMIPESRGFVPENGMPVNLNTYWLRRLRDGDVVLAPQPGPAKRAKEAPKDEGKEG